MLQVISVRQLNTYVRSLIEGDPKLTFLAVCGEISNFKNHYGSGHLYFTLKDNDSLIRCVMFRTNAANLKFFPKDGMKVVCKGRVSLYEKDGQYQFYCEQMQPAGLGDLAERFEQLKAKLTLEGLFDRERKKSLVPFPKKVGVVTSKTGAALQDIINVIGRRYPVCELIVSPAVVQGEQAPDSIIEALRCLCEENPDVIILGRGGGSAEDLWAFNDEKLARTVDDIQIPVISAVGHETDFTICDFVADVRAATPSAAAELAVPDIFTIFENIAMLNQRLSNAETSLYSSALAKFERLKNSRVIRDADKILEEKQIYIDRLFDRIDVAVNSKMLICDKKLAESVASLQAMSPLKILSKGYLFAAKNGENIKSVSQVEENDLINLTFCDGSAECEVLNKTRRN